MNINTKRRILLAPLLALGVYLRAFAVTPRVTADDLRHLQLKEPPAKERAALSQSIGEVILSNDLGWMNAGSPDVRAASTSFQAEYAKVCDMSEESRVEFFWVLMMHLDIAAVYALEFEETLVRDSCFPAFMKRLEEATHFMDRPGATGFASEKYKGRHRDIAIRMHKNLKRSAESIKIEMQNSRKE